MLTASTILFLIVLTIGLTKKKILYRGNEVYLIRYTIIKCKWFSLKIHKAVMSDPADLHDHPWNYTSLILWGGYWEESKRESGVTQKTWYKPGSLLFRDGERPHRLIIPKDKYCISLILTTKKWRDWGFIKNGQWVSNKETSY